MQSTMRIFDLLQILISENCILFFSDAPFLLRFLRTKKFSIPQAQDMIERYLIIREVYPQWFRRLDVLDPTISDILDSG